MLKRTKGRFLLTLLVITGLAGTLKNTSLNKQERKFVVNELKDSKIQLLESLKGLSDAQLNFKPSAQRWSIKECVYHITMAEKGLWDLLTTTMEERVSLQTPAERIPDEDVLKKITDRSNKLTAPEMLQPSNAPWKSTGQAIDAFKTMRADHIKYVKTSTEDLRDHFVDLPLGRIDAYQLIIFLSGHSVRHTAQIREIMADTHFPKK